MFSAARYPIENPIEIVVTTGDVICYLNRMKNQSACFRTIPAIRQSECFHV